MVDKLALESEMTRLRKIGLGPINWLNSEIHFVIVCPKLVFNQTCYLSSSHSYSETMDQICYSKEYLSQINSSLKAIMGKRAWTSL